ncbi:MAG: hypothetical protein Q9181_000960 [Wetmoreana brouardii]
MGTGLLSSLHTTLGKPGRKHGYQWAWVWVLLLGSYDLLPCLRSNNANPLQPLCAVTQVRALGGALSLEFASLIFNHKATSRLKSVLASAEVSLILSNPDAIKAYPPVQIKVIRSLYGVAYRGQIVFPLYVATAALVAALFIYQRHPPDIDAVMALGEKIQTEDAVWPNHAIASKQSLLCGV